MREKTYSQHIPQDDDYKHDDLYKWGEAKMQQIIIENCLGLTTPDEFVEKCEQFLKEYGDAAIESLRPKT